MELVWCLDSLPLRRKGALTLNLGKLFPFCATPIIIINIIIITCYIDIAKENLKNLAGRKKKFCSKPIEVSYILPILNSLN